MIPMETLKEKNSWLMASSKIWKEAAKGQSLKMRGYIIKKAVHTGTHLSAFVNMVQCQGIACDHNTRTRSMGIMQRETRSIPPSTPLYTINAVTPINKRANRTGDTGEVINEVK